MTPAERREILAALFNSPEVAVSFGTALAHNRFGNRRARRPRLGLTIVDRDIAAAAAAVIGRPARPATTPRGPEYRITMTGRTVVDLVEEIVDDLDEGTLARYHAALDRLDEANGRAYV